MHKMTQDEWKKSVEWVGIVAGCLLEKNGKYLFVQEKQKKVYGLWNLPAGYVDRDETIEEGAVREVKEESGYDVELIEEIGLFHESVGKPIKHIFSAKIVGGELKIPESEILDVRWLTYDEVYRLNEKGELRASWIWEIISKTDKD